MPTSETYLKHRTPGQKNTSFLEKEQNPNPSTKNTPQTVLQGGSVLLTPASALKFQRKVGNHAVANLLGARRSPGGTIQAKLAVGPMDNPYEQEADRVADQVTAMPQAQFEALSHGLAAPVSQTGANAGQIQRWGLKVGYGVAGMKGHEALTEVAMNDWKKENETQIEQLENRKKGETGQAKKHTEEEIKALKLQLGSQDDVVAGSRWNDLLHNSTIAGLGYEIGKAGTLTHASHEGELQFLHSMAATVAEQAWQTQHKIMMWAEFSYRVANGNIPTSTKLKDVTTATELDFNGGPTFAKLFENWGDQTVGWLFTGSQKESEHGKAKAMAIGSMLHMLQDSFCMSHTQRVAAKKEDQAARLIKGFNVYTEQQGGISGRHARADIVQGRRIHSSETRVKKTAGAEEAVEVSARVIGFWRKGNDWNAVRQYLQGVLGLTPELEAQKPQDGRWQSEEPDPTGKRMVSASGRLFRKTLILDIFKKAFGRTKYFEPDAVTELRKNLIAYNSELKKELKNLTVKIDMSTRDEIYLTPQFNAILASLLAIQPAYQAIDAWKKKDEDRQTRKAALDQIRPMLQDDLMEVTQDINAIDAALKEEKMNSEEVSTDL